MAYTKKQREMRRCKKIKANGEQCRGSSKLKSEFCSLHWYQHSRELPKTEAERTAAKIRRARRRAEPQKRATCQCEAFAFPHRLSSGRCKYPR